MLYAQLEYGTCRDLGPWGAVVAQGWNRVVQLTGAEAKAMKQQINTMWIYPPKAERAEAFAASNWTTGQVIAVDGGLGLA